MATAAGDLKRIKQMRKGTRSCKECRRRKIKCIYPEDKQVCEDCALHSRRCAAQGVISTTMSSASPRQTVRVRVTKLESVLERLSKTYAEANTRNGEVHTEELGQTPNALFKSNRNFTMKDLGELDLQSQERSPLFSLFNNDMLMKSGEANALPLNAFSTVSFSGIGLGDREKLLSTIASEPNISDIIKVGGGWFLGWQAFYPGLKDMEIARSLGDYLSHYLSQSHPAMVAVALLCLAMSLQHIRLGFDDEDLHLSTSPQDLQVHILAAVDQIVLCNDKYMARREGMTALILRGKIHAESNQLRKSWLRIRQAILIGQKTDYASVQPGLTAKELTDRQRFMGGLFETDRFFSLVLGLPYVVDDSFTDHLASMVLLSPSNILARMRALRRVTSIAAGTVCDRNADMEEASLNRTKSIEESLGSAAASMPDFWWDLATHSQSLTDPAISHENLMTQLWFHQTRAFLHLPFMLRASSDPQFEENRFNCLDSNRKLLRIFVVMASNPSLAAYMCKCEDFQCLLAAIMIIIGLLQYASRSIEPTGSSFEEDMELIDMTAEVFRFHAQQQGGSIAKQGLRILETLTTFLEHDGEAPSSESSENNDAQQITLFVPYFGKISVESRKTPVRRRGQKGVDSPPGLYGEIPPTDNAIYSPDFGSTAEPFRLPQFDDELYQFQALPANFNGQTSTAFNLDDIMLGAELEQNWNSIVDQDYPTIYGNANPYYCNSG